MKLAKGANLQLQEAEEVDIIIYKVFSYKSMKSCKNLYLGIYKEMLLYTVFMN